MSKFRIGSLGAYVFILNSDSAFITLLSSKQKCGIGRWVELQGEKVWNKTLKAWGIKLQDNDSNPNLKKFYWLALIFALNLFAIYYFQNHYAHFMILFSNIFPLFIAGAAVVTSCLALHSYWENLESNLSRIWLGFALGMIFWFLSEISWVLCTVVFDAEIPYASVGDLYRLVGYGFLFLLSSRTFNFFDQPYPKN